MADDEREPLLTPRGREWKLENHENRIDALEGRMSAIEGKEATRDKRWDWAVRSITTVGVGIIVGVVVAILTTGVHP